ncbi:hypothetical protein WR25_21253 [Diploscapter pachys]|uniref:EamA domain-containing protein n=1 Tax=Diploscapter pachys TaxID=2018661 RepID=A0A2A2JD32_9BILA|nr:hypothetical protein WR25_21253 [Diploscapter pachys]
MTLCDVISLIYRFSADSFSYYESIYGGQPHGERQPFLYAPGVDDNVLHVMKTPRDAAYATSKQPKQQPYANLPQPGSSSHYQSLPRGVQPHRNPYAIQRPPETDEDSEDAINCSPCCENDNISRTFRSIVLGQILSLCLCGTGVSSQLLSNQGVNAPAAQAFTNYFLLCFVYCTALSCKGGDDALLEIIKRRGWRYLILAFFDVQANYLIVYAYQYTNLTSIQLLDCSTIPIVLLLSWLFLSARYLITHIIGVCICLVGISCVIFADAVDGKGLGGSNRALGDVLCLAATVLYAICNVTEEFLVKQYNRMEYLGMIGLFGSLISGVQLAALEHRALATLNWNGSIVGCFVLFGISMFIFYSLVSIVLQKTSALMFNLSTLTADFYSLLLGIFLFKDTFHYLYFVSFVIVLIGSIVYSLRETEVRDPDEPRRVTPVGSSTAARPLSVSPAANGDIPLPNINCPVHGLRAQSSLSVSGTTTQRI